MYTFIIIILLVTISLAFISRYVVNTGKTEQEYKVYLRLKIIFRKFTNLDNPYVWWIGALGLIILASVIGVIYGSPKPVYYTIAGAIIKCFLNFKHERE